MKKLGFLLISLSLISNFASAGWRVQSNGYSIVLDKTEEDSKSPIRSVALSDRTFDIELFSESGDTVGAPSARVKRRGADTLALGAIDRLLMHAGMATLGLYWGAARLGLLRAS